MKDDDDARADMALDSFLISGLVLALSVLLATALGFVLWVIYPHVLRLWGVA